MTDIVDAQRRSEMMAGIRGQNTAPELAVRRIAHRMGLRFRLHRNDLPGRPDLVFPRHRTAVFVHGCFWHRHEGCRRASTPKSRTVFWTTKFAANVERDARQQAALRTLGWRVLVIWQCETKDEVAVERRLAALMGGERAVSERGNAPTVDYQAKRREKETPRRLHRAPARVDACPRAASAVEPGLNEQNEVHCGVIR